MTRPIAALQGIRSLAVLAASVLMAPTAAASPSFPIALRDAAQMPCTPLCDVCHITTAGGPGNIKPGGFASVLQGQYDLFFGQPATVKPAIDLAAAANLNTDGDDMPDVAELAIGRNPNNPDPNAFLTGCGAGGGDAATPEYGCGGGRVAAGQSIDGLASVLAASTLIAGIGLLRRRARRG